MHEIFTSPYISAYALCIMQAIAYGRKKINQLDQKGVILGKVLIPFQTSFDLHDDDRIL